jgi:hypothetical protein
MRYKLLILLVCLSAFSFTQAQSLKQWTWDTYKIKFKIPDNMTVQENNADKFEVKSGSITMDIYPRKGENFTYDGMKAAIVKWANQSDLSYDTYNSSGSEQPIYLSNLNGYWGCAIDGKKIGFPATMLLLVDPQYADISFYVWISYSAEYYNDVLQILKSFEPM